MKSPEIGQTPMGNCKEQHLTHDVTTSHMHTELESLISEEALEIDCHSSSGISKQISGSHFVTFVLQRHSCS